MNSKERIIHRSEIQAIRVRVRDFATSLLGDPIQGDRAASRAMTHLRDVDPKLRPTGPEIEDWLNERVLFLCAEQYVPGAADRVEALVLEGRCEYGASDQEPEEDPDPEDPEPEDDALDPEEERRAPSNDNGDEEELLIKEAA